MRMLGKEVGWAWMFLGLMLVGCGTTKSQQGTQQLLISNAIDLSISRMALNALAGKSIYLDTKYIVETGPQGFGKAPYIISSLRQHLLASGCRLQDSAEEAEFVMEARIGSLSTDNHDITYGIPANSMLNTTASLITNTPALPAFPEISFARRTQQLGIAKIVAFVYDRKLGTRIWQSGIQVTQSTSSNFWILGAGPFQWGTIHDGTQFAGEQIGLPFMISNQAELDVENKKLIRQYEDQAAYFKSSKAQGGEDSPDSPPARFPQQQGTDRDTPIEIGPLPAISVEATNKQR